MTMAAARFSPADDPKTAALKMATPILAQARPRPERLARLGRVFEQIASRAALDLADLLPSPVQLNLGEVLVSKAGPFLTERHGAGAIGVFRGDDAATPILIGIDGTCIDMIVEAAFGADGSEPVATTSRPLSRIELRLAGAIFQKIIRTVHSASADPGATVPDLDRVECLTGQPVLVRREDEWLIARLEFCALDRVGELFILMPLAAAGTLRDMPADASPGPSGGDPGWSAHIQQHLTRTDITLRAILDEQEFTLGQIVELKPGDMLPLRATPQSQVKLVSNEQPLLWCELGQADGAYTLRVQDFVSAEQDLIDAILSE